MHCHEALLERRTVHNYSPEPVSEEVLLKALEAAVAAPNHRMTEPWRFTRVGHETRQRLVNISVSLKQAAAQQPLPDAAIEKVQRKMLHPSELLVVSQIKNDKPDVAREDYAAVACAIHGLMLALWADGVGSKWSTGAVTCDERTYRLLGIDADTEEIVGFVWVGKAEQETPKPRRRRSLDSVLRRLP